MTPRMKRSKKIPVNRLHETVDDRIPIAKSGRYVVNQAIIWIAIVFIAIVVLKNFM